MADPTHTPTHERELPANFKFKDYADGWNHSLSLALDIVESHAQLLHRAGEHSSARAVLALVDKLTPRTPRLTENAPYGLPSDSQDDGA